MSYYERELRQRIEFLPDRLYYVALSSPPPASALVHKHFFSTDHELVYWNFYLDFGPLNLGHLLKFCRMMNHKLGDPALKDKVIYFYSGTHAHKRANAAYLISSWAMLCLKKSPEDAFKPFRSANTPFPPWHDATPTICSFNLTIMDTLRGLYKAREYNFFDFENFDLAEYEHYEQVENGDLNWCMDGKFIAFAGPHATRESSPGGYHSLCPDDYVPYYLRKNVSLVVRLNKKYYDAKRFTNHGINHIDLYFIDGSNPPDHILAKFLQLSEETRGAIAVHCKAGLGRTGSVIGCYMMKHFKMTAEETIGWLRIVRPGSIIGPQQQYMKDMQPRMWREGQLYREKFASVKSGGMAIAEDISSSMLSSRSYKPGGSQKAIDGGGIGSERDEEKERAGDSQGDHLRLRRQQMKDDMKISSTTGSSPSASAGVKGVGSSPSDNLARPNGYIGNLLSSWK